MDTSRPKRERTLHNNNAAYLLDILLFFYIFFIFINELFFLLSRNVSICAIFLMPNPSSSPGGCGILPISTSTHPQQPLFVPPVSFNLSLLRDLQRIIPPLSPYQQRPKMCVHVRSRAATCSAIRHVRVCLVLFASVCIGIIY